MSRISEQALACAVVEQAMLEGCVPPDAPRNTRSKGMAAKTQERHEAWSFLTAQRGAWADSRAFWCQAADVDPDMVRKAALARGKHPMLVEAEEQAKAARLYRQGGEAPLAGSPGHVPAG